MARKYKSYVIPSSRITGPKRDSESLRDYALRMYSKAGTRVNREFDFEGYALAGITANYRIKTFKKGSFYYTELFIHECLFAGGTRWAYLSASPALETRRDMDRVAENHIKHRCDKDKFQ